MKMFSRRLAARLAAACAAGVAVPVGAQQPRRPVIGFLGSANAEEWRERLDAFRLGLRDFGRVEGTNVAIEFRWADGRYDRLPSLAADLVAQRVDLIVVLGNTASVIAAKAATTTIPIVFRMASDPLDLGIVASLSRPGGNVTGVTTLGVAVGPKQLELLRELVPEARTVAILVNPANPVLAQEQRRTLPAAARTLGMEPHLFEASAESDFVPLFEALSRQRVDALVIAVDAFFNSKSAQLAALASARRMPTVSTYREFALAGGLLSYGGGIEDAARQAGVYAARILAGERAGDLPVQQVARIELVVNLKAARQIGIRVSDAFLSRADEVIE